MAATSKPTEQTASFTWLVWLKGKAVPSRLVILPGPDVTPQRDALSNIEEAERDE